MGGLWLLVVGLDGVAIVMGVVWLASVVMSWGVAGSGGGGMVIPTDEAAKVASTDQFFYIILERFAFFRSVTMVAMVPTILALGGMVVLRGGGRRSAWRASSRVRERATVRGAYLVKRGWRGSRGRVSGRG